MRSDIKLNLVKVLMRNSDIGCHIMILVDVDSQLNARGSVTRCRARLMLYGGQPNASDSSFVSGFGTWCEDI
jgi:hypothetical protein